MSEHNGGIARDEDVNEPYLPRPARMELADLHRHMEAIKRDLGDTKSALFERLHSVELALAKKPVMPAWLGGLLGAILVFTLGQLGTTVYWGGQLTQKVDSLPHLKAQCDECDRKITVIREVQVDVLSRLKEAEKQLAGGTDDRWRKADDLRVMQDLQRYIDTRFEALEHRVDAHDDRAKERDRWWQQLWGTGVMKGVLPHQGK